MRILYKTHIPKIREKELKKFYYGRRLSLSEIGKIFGLSTQTILNYCRFFGIQTRDVSESLSGRRIFWADKIAKSNTGKILSSETKRKISLSNIGKIGWNRGLTKAENPDRVLYGCVGEKHWNWKGGISEISNLIRQTSEYGLWRRKCFERDWYKCIKCGIKDSTLNVHHIIRFSELLKKKQYLYDIRNGITLCGRCHKEEHRRKNERKNHN